MNMNYITGMRFKVWSRYSFVVKVNILVSKFGIQTVTLNFV